MQLALPNGEDVDYVNAHATSTPMGDDIEARVINSVFQKQHKPVLVSSTKGATGHLLGAAGAVEAAFTVMTVHTGWVPLTLNLNVISQEQHHTNVQHVTNTAIHVPTLSNAVSNSFGFGGVNASLAFRKC
jgi:3-oxoacyl-[acyl-carrier-protein] synthase II